MKKLLLLLILFCTPILWSQNNQWHVRPYSDNYTNPSGADGTSFTTAWCLQYALSGGGGSIQPGDTVWLHGGIYKGQFVSNLTGSDEEEITVTSFPDEWAVIDGNVYEFTPEIVEPQFPCGTAGIQRGEIGEIDIETESDTIASSDELYKSLNRNETLNSNDDDDDSFIITNRILDIQGAYTHYINFEVTCLGLSESKSINRVQINYASSSAFHKLTGIYQNPTIPKKNKFSNLVIRNIPGTAIGSWKKAAGSEIYGCIMYNNGYIRFDKQESTTGNPLPTPYQIWVYGKGPGIYTQNTTNDTREIENNIFVNGYDNAIELWSANRQPDIGAEYLKNYKIRDNFFVNNGGYGRRHRAYTDPYADLTNPESSNHPNNTGFDSKPNLLISSASEVPETNKVRNVTVDNNIFYLNNRGAFISGFRLTNADSITFTNNLIFKGHISSLFYGNNNHVTYRNNLHWGKYLEFKNLSGDFHTRNYDVDDNDYFLWNFIWPYMYIVPNPSFNSSLPSSSTNPDRISLMLSEFQNNSSSGYNSDVNSSVTKIFGDNDFPGRLYFNGNNPPFKKITKIVQNKYNPNLFYVAIYNTRSSTSENDNITIPFEDFNTSAAEVVNKNYKIRDVQNYYGTFSGDSGACSGTGITFPMTLTEMERPIGFFDRCIPHTFKDFAVFTVEFNCLGVASERLIENQTDDASTLLTYDAKNKVTFTNYTLGSNSGVNTNVNSIAGKQIVIKPQSTIYKGASFWGKIENPCPDIALAESTERHIRPYKNNEDQSKTMEITIKDYFKIYPNPSTGLFTIENSQTNTISSVNISNANSAQLIFSQEYINEAKVNIDISSASKGLYIIQVTFKDGSTKTRTIAKK